LSLDSQAILQCFASLPIADGLHRRLGPLCPSIVDANLVMAHFFGGLVGILVIFYQRWGKIGSNYNLL